MKNKWPDDEGYTDTLTRDVSRWCDKVDAIEQGDDQTLPELVRVTDTRTLLGVINHYDDIWTDHERHGEPYSEWDHEVRHSVWRALKERGLTILPSELELVPARPPNQSVN